MLVCPFIVFVFGASTAALGEDAQPVPDPLAAAVESYLRLAADGDWKQAAALLEQLSEQHPNSPVVQMMREHAQLRVTAESGESLEVENLTQERSEAARRHIADMLETRLEVDFDDTPLKEVMRHMASMWGVNIVLDERGLNEVGATPDTRVNVRVNGVRLSTVLELVLEPLHLGYAVDDEVIRITSSERLAGPLTTRVYSVSDLIQAPTNDAGDAPDADVEAALLKLAQTIQDTIDPNSWSRYGGSGYLQHHLGTRSLVIRQRPGAHQEIADLLGELRRESGSTIAHAVWVVELSADEARRFGIDATHDSVVLSAEEALVGGLAVRSDAQSCTLRDRQTESVKFSAPGGERSLLLNAAIAQDRRTIRVSVAAPDSMTPEDVLANVHSARVPDGGVALFVLTPPTASARPQTKLRVCVVVPKIMVQDEEEELLGSPVQ
jgi:hypothetical protein